MLGFAIWHRTGTEVKTYNLSMLGCSHKHRRVFLLSTQFRNYITSTVLITMYPPLRESWVTHSTLRLCIIQSQLIPCHLLYAVVYAVFQNLETSSAPLPRCKVQSNSIFHAILRFPLRHLNVIHCSISNIPPSSSNIFSFAMVGS